MQVGELYNALRVYRAIEAAGMTPNVITCCGLISALGKARRQAERHQGHRLWLQLRASGQCLDAAAYRTGKLQAETGACGICNTYMHRAILHKYQLFCINGI